MVANYKPSSYSPIKMSAENHAQIVDAPYWQGAGSRTCKSGFSEKVSGAAPHWTYPVPAGSSGPSTGHSWAP